MALHTVLWRPRAMSVPRRASSDTRSAAAAAIRRRIATATPLCDDSTNRTMRLQVFSATKQVVNTTPLGTHHTEPYLCPLPPSPSSSSSSPSPSLEPPLDATRSDKRDASGAVKRASSSLSSMAGQGNAAASTASRTMALPPSLLLRLLLLPKLVPLSPTALRSLLSTNRAAASGGAWMTTGVRERAQ